uniref:hypothetical protein n=1 Tax=Corynebacterium auriscanis TaxID=99807 RepID=UPI00396A64A4
MRGQNKQVTLRGQNKQVTGRGLNKQVTLRGLNKRVTGRGPTEWFPRTSRSPSLSWQIRGFLGRGLPRTNGLRWWS